MEKNELAQKIYEVAHLTGEFLLRSGLTSHEYFDKYQFTCRPELLKPIAKLMAPLVPKDTEVLAGLEVGGIPLATMVAQELGLPMVIVRKEAKNYGTCKFAEGPNIKGKKLCIIEDVITTGGQVSLSTKDLRAQGAIINEVVCVIYRGQKNGEEPKLIEAKVEMKAVFTRTDFPK